MSQKIQIEDIELLLEQLDELDAKQTVMSSIAWSYAFSVASTIVRLQRIGDAEDERYRNMTQQEREDAIRSAEARLQHYQDLLGWASDQANPEFLPDGAQVARMLTEPNDDSRIAAGDTPSLAKEFGLSEEEIERLQKQNDERFAREQQLQAMAAKQHQLEVEKAVDWALKGGHTFESIPLDDAIRMADRIADKAAQYAGNKVAQALRTQRQRKRDALNAQARLLRKIEENADALFDRFTNLRDSESEASPVEAYAENTA